MKKRPTKAEIRAMLNRQVDDYLKEGGELHQVRNGVSGRDDPDGPLPAGSLGFEKPKEERTLVPEVIAAIESRRRPGKVASKPRKKQPVKKMIYDDFGEPLRWEWVEE